MVLAYPDYLKVFESYTNASSNQLEAVTTQDKCQTRSLRPLIWNLPYTTVQCYIISTGATNRQGQSISRQVSDYAVQIQCHQLELLAIVKTY
jgi:hypothetical protein